jgi:hypothetical protein
MPNGNSNRLYSAYETALPRSGGGVVEGGRSEGQSASKCARFAPAQGAGQRSSGQGASESAASRGGEQRPDAGEQQK